MSTDLSRMTRLFVCLLAAAVLLASTAPAMAQPTADRSAMEAKKKAADEKRKAVAEARNAKVKETSGQREERLKTEKRSRAAQRALDRAQAAITAANRRKNKAAMTLMTEAWKLDPQNRDYAFLAGQLAAGVKNDAAEFNAYVGYMVISGTLLSQLGPGDSEFKRLITSRRATAQERLHVLRNTITSGRVQITTKPATCDIMLDGSFVGVGSGTIEAIAGQHKVAIDCPGHYPIDQFLNVRAGDSNRHLLRPTPIPYFGWLVINVKPSEGVTIFLNDVPLENRRAEKATKAGKITGAGSKTDPIRLHAKKWIIRFKKPGFDRWHRRIKIERDSMFTVNAVLETMQDNVESSGE